MKFFVATLLSVIVIGSYAGENNLGIANDGKEKSTFFKMSRNSNRVHLFEELQSFIKIKTTKSSFAVNAQAIVSQYTTTNELKQLLGEPNVALKNAYIYTLNPTTGCKAVIEFDAKKEVTFIAIKDCF